MSEANPAIGRGTQMLAPPVKIDRAFDHPEQVWQAIERGAPYKTITAVHKDPANSDTPGWFRNFWALGGKVIFDGAEDFFYNPNFIEAAKQSFQAEVIQPLAMMTNLNVPAAASPPHLDLPFFRGAHKREVPSWMLAPMGYSGLFQAWAIPVASAITWFIHPETHQSDGSIRSVDSGDFEYWPEGPAAPSSRVTPPVTNTALLADNEYMYHRVGAFGAPHDYLSSGIDSTALLHLTREGWEIRVGDECIHRYAKSAIRTSILWKAYCFKDQQTADDFAEERGQLTPQQIVDIFCRDLKQRNISFQQPTDLEKDQAWIDVITRTYTPAIS